MTKPKMSKVLIHVSSQNVFLVQEYIYIFYVCIFKV